MEIISEDTRIGDLVEENNWDSDKLQLIFGDHLNTFFMKEGSLNTHGNNQWIWFLDSCSGKTSKIIYSHLNSIASQYQSQEGWNHLWRLNIAPRAKHFLWLLTHGKIKTVEYLYSLNLGAMCNLDKETIDHLFLNCPKTLGVWNVIGHILGNGFSIPNSISEGYLLADCHASTSVFLKSIIAAGAWFIWKSQCKLIMFLI